MKITCLIDILSFTSLSKVWFYHFCFTDMESFFKQIVDTFTKSDELEEFAILWSIEEDQYIRERIFQLKCQELFDLIDQDVMIPSPEQMEIDDVIPSPDSPTKSTEIAAPSSRIAASSHIPGPSKPKYFRPWENQVTPEVQSISYGRVQSPQPGPSGINHKTSSSQHTPSGIHQTGQGLPNNDPKPYTYGMKRQRVFAKNKAIDTTYQIKFNDQWKGDKLKDINDQLHHMFDDVLNNMRGKPSDLGRVVVHHGSLKNPIVVPLQPWEKLDSQTVLDGITKVLNSNEELIVDDSLEINVGSVEIPSGSGGEHLPITTLFGQNNSLKRKRSIFEVITDRLCLPISIGLCFLKTCRKVKMMDWKKLTEPTQSMLDNVIKYRTCPKSYYIKTVRQIKTRGSKENGRSSM